MYYYFDPCCIKCIHWQIQSINDIRRPRVFFVLFFLFLAFISLIKRRRSLHSHSTPIHTHTQMEMLLYQCTIAWRWRLCASFILPLCISFLLFV